MDTIARTGGVVARVSAPPQQKIYTKQDLDRVAAEAYSKALRDVHQTATHPTQPFPAVFIHNSAAVDGKFLNSTTSITPSTRWRWLLAGGLALVAFYLWEDSRRRKDIRRRRLEYSTLHRIAYWILNQ